MDKLIYTPPEQPLEILYHDRDIAVINKPSGLLSVPGGSPDLADCAESRLAEQLGELVYSVHRLDLWTSGLLIFALRRKAEADLHAQFRDRIIKKKYIALAAGHIQKSTGTMDWPLATDPNERPKQCVDYSKGKPALTHYQIIEYRREHTLVALFPYTGRSHQLRVHLATLGHPILGDPFYAPESIRKQANRLMLHAEWIQFQHPYHHECMEFCSPSGF